MQNIVHNIYPRLFPVWSKMSSQQCALKWQWLLVLLSLRRFAYFACKHQRQIRETMSKLLSHLYKEQNNLFEFLFLSISPFFEYHRRGICALVQCVFGTRASIKVDALCSKTKTFTQTFITNKMFWLLLIQDERDVEIGNKIWSKNP